MNKQAPRAMIVDARYTMTCNGGDVLLVAQDDDGYWRLWDVTSGRYSGPRYNTSGACYFGALKMAEEAAEEACATYALRFAVDGTKLSEATT